MTPEKELAELRTENFELIQRLQIATRDVSELRSRVSDRLRIKAVMLPKDGVIQQLEITQVFSGPDGVIVEVRL